MKKSIVLLLALVFIFCFTVSVSAAEVTEASVPVTLTVINTMKPISVTVPAVLPISMIDGYLVTANNAKIINHGESGSIQVTAVNVQPGAFRIGSYENFSAVENTIALAVNGCKTENAGKLPLTEAAFPTIEAGASLAIQYQAKVSASSAVANVNAATVIFTIAAAEEG